MEVNEERKGSTTQMSRIKGNGGGLYSRHVNDLKYCCSSVSCILVAREMAAEEVVEVEEEEDEFEDDNG
jgi:hypothetical protein